MLRLISPKNIIKMKLEIRIFIEGYETFVSKIKQNELKAISDCIFEYIQSEKIHGEIEINRYSQPVVLNADSSFMNINNKRISLNPYNFHKKLDIEFNYVDEMNYVHYCDDIWCTGGCGVLSCGCIDVCRCMDY